MCYLFFVIIGLISLYLIFFVMREGSRAIDDHVEALMRWQQDQTNKREKCLCRRGF